MPTSSFSLIALGGLLLSTAARAEAPRPIGDSGAPRPMYKVIDRPRLDPTTSGVTSRIVYVHRCPELVGCQVKQGSDDSRTDTSSIADGLQTLGDFPHGDAVWNATFQCVKDAFAAYDITITDQDPGNVPHFENMVGGRPSDITSDPNLQNAGGVAPFNCGEIPNAIVYTFAQVYGPNAEELCWTSAQEIAHAFGLEHEFLQKDPMTYLSGDLPKRFRDETAPCGELSPKNSCQCGGTTQNSYRRIVNLFGFGAPIAPVVSFKRPIEGRDVQPGYTTLVEATDDVRVEKVELYIDGTLVGMATTPVGDRFEVPAPADLAAGSHTFEARAYDVQNVMTSTSLTVNVGPPCTASKGCVDDDVCVQGACVAGPDAPGGLGDICQRETECLSGQCADAGEAQKHCVETCSTADSGSCPDDFDCIDDGAGGGVCWPSGGGGCCDTSGTRPHAPLLLGLGVAIVLLRRRKRR